MDSSLTDHIVEEYSGEKALGYEMEKSKAWRIEVERYSLSHILSEKGGVSSFAGRRVLDLGYGDGVYIRMALQYGAAEAVGVDLVPDMVAEARRQQGDAGTTDNGSNDDCCSAVSKPAHDSLSRFLWPIASRFRKSPRFNAVRNLVFSMSSLRISCSTMRHNHA